VKKTTLYLLCIIILVFVLVANTRASAVGAAVSLAIPDGTESEPPDPELQRALLQAQPNDYVRVIVYLREQVDATEAATGPLNATETRARVVSTLQFIAERSQAALRNYLADAQASGLVASYTPFWIFNGAAVRARPEAVRAIARRSDVASVRLDRWRQWVGPAPDTPAAVRTVGMDDAEWGVAHIRADQVWASLHISGTGAVVAGMDTGVDWLHPALQASYRGYSPHGLSNHIYNWYDATGGGTLYPVDGHGHGTHTIGTAVGQDGIGVAPGARWIGIRVLNNQGYGLDSWIHAGFQWALAPGGDPSQAPDVVNCSWGNDNGGLVTFQPDLQALRAAGILVTVASGNNGPRAGTVGSPASLPEAFAVGATDPEDEAANFSSRGPSPWGEIRPHVAAPGVNVRSSLPGGVYGLGNGTSMATPHVTGIAALLRSVSPTLSVTRTAFIITSTALPLGDATPNNDTGWGRVDAFSAVTALAHAGFITGSVTRQGDRAAIAGATVVAASHGGTGGGTTVAGEDGGYLLALAPDVYDLTASAFGYQSQVFWRAAVATGTTTVVNFPLAPLPTGTLQGRITAAATGEPVTATVTVLDTPLASGGDSYRFDLPAGPYTIQVRALGYRVVTRTVHVLAGGVTEEDVSLAAAPTVLLVDSGAWYYDTQTAYFRQALDDLAYAYDEWSIKYLPEDQPTAPDLLPYDVVVWSAPLDSPGYIRAGGAIIGYLADGGRLMLSGQDVGYWDGGAAGLWSEYYYEYLKARYISDNAPSRVLYGLPDDLFAGLTITITGPGGADNQHYPDTVDIQDPDAAARTFVYQDGGCGGLRVGTCLDYRAIYLSFGFEAINERAARREVMDRSIAWLVAPPPAAGLELTPASQMRIGAPGSTVTHTLRVRHLGQGGSTDTVHLSLDGGSWDTDLGTSSLSLAPCASAEVVITVTLPPTAGWDVRDVVTLTARSTISPALSQAAVLYTKAPASILLVDDDRWYNQESKYEDALARLGWPYDYWRTGRNGLEPPGSSPTLSTLQHYPVIIWFTGYDWFAPVTDEEIEKLSAYLDGGGRLFLSSQDFLYYHHEKSFSWERLGILDYREDVTPTLAAGAPQDPVGDRLGPYPLQYPFKNWSDAVWPAADVVVSFRDQERRPVTLAHRGADYKTLFFSFPFETLPEEGRVETLERAVGWLSWLGESIIRANRETVSAGERLTYTLALRHDGPEAVVVSLSNTLPLSLTLVPGSLTGPAVYEPAERRVTWQGSLTAGAGITFTYQVTAPTNAPAGTTILNVARFGLEEQGMRFRRAAVVRFDAPDLSPSALRCRPSPLQAGRIVTCALTMANAGPADAARAEVLIPIRDPVSLVPGSLSWTGGGTLDMPTGTVGWAGPVGAGQLVTLSYQLDLLGVLFRYPAFYHVALIEDGGGGAWERPTWVFLNPRRLYLPLVLRRSRTS